MTAAVVTAEYLLPTGVRAWISAWTDNPADAVKDAVDAGARHIRVDPDPTECPHCGAKISAAAGACFTCGQLTP